MAKVDVFAGICGFHTTILAQANDDMVQIKMVSECPAINRLGEHLTEVDPFQEITFRRGGPLTLQMGAQHCSHTACPVPVGILKAVEVAAGLALPKDVTIQVSKD